MSDFSNRMVDEIVARDATAPGSFVQNNEVLPAAREDTSLGLVPGMLAAIRDPSAGSVPDPTEYDPATMAASGDNMRLFFNDSFDTEGNLVYLNIFGQRWNRERLEKSDIGRELMDLAGRERRGRAGLWEGIKRGGWAKLAPYFNDVYAVGLTVKETAKAADTFKKLNDHQPVSGEDLLGARLFLANGDRESRQTGWGQFGSIISQAPAFAGELFTSAGIGTAAKKTLAKGAEYAAINGTKGFIRAAAEKLTRKMVRSKLAGELGEKGARYIASHSLDDLVEHMAKPALRAGVKDAGAKVAYGVADDVFNRSLPKALAQAARDKGEALTVDEINLLIDSVRTYSAKAFRRQAVLAGDKNVATRVGAWAHDHLVKNLMDGLDPEYGLEKGLRQQLSKAAGILYRGSVYGVGYLGADEAVHSALAASLGINHVVTPTELSLLASGTLQGNQQLVDNARWLSLGMRWSEYGSEFSGPALRAVAKGGVSAGVGRALATKLGRAKGFVSNNVKAAERASRLRGEIFARLTGREISDAHNMTVREVAEHMVTANLGRKAVAGMGKEAYEAAVTDATKYVRRELNVPLLGRLMGAFMTKTGQGPAEFERFFKRVGYHGTIEELGEESYNSFIQGLLGLNDAPDQDMQARIGRALKGGFQHFNPVGKQFWVEAAAFALPAVTRAGILNAQTQLLQGPLGKANKFAHGLDVLVGLHNAALADKAVGSDDGEGGFSVNSYAPARRGGEKSSLETIETRLKGEETAKEGSKDRGVAPESILHSLGSVEDGYVETARFAGSAGKPGSAGWRKSIAWALQAVGGLIDGNYFAMFADPVGSFVNYQDNRYGGLLRAGATMYTTALNNEVTRRRAEFTGDPSKSSYEAVEADPAFQESVGRALRGRLHSFLRNNGTQILSHEAIKTAVDKMREDGDTRSWDEIQDDVIGAFHDIAAGTVTLTSDEIDANVPRNEGESDEDYNVRRKAYEADREKHAAATGLSYHRHPEGDFSYGLGGGPHEQDSPARKAVYNALATTEGPGTTLEVRAEGDKRLFIDGLGSLLGDSIGKDVLDRFGADDTEVDKASLDDKVAVFQLLGVDFGALNNDEVVKKVRAASRALSAAYDELEGDVPLVRSDGKTVSVVRQGAAGSKYRIVKQDADKFEPSAAATQRVFDTPDEAVDFLNDGGNEWSRGVKNLTLTPATTIYAEDPADLYFHFPHEVGDIFGHTVRTAGMEKLFGSELLDTLASAPRGSAEWLEARDKFFDIHRRARLINRYLAYGTEAALREGGKEEGKLPGQALTAEEEAQLFDKDFMRAVFSREKRLEFDDNNPDASKKSFADIVHEAFSGDDGYESLLEDRMRGMRAAQHTVASTGKRAWIVPLGAYNTPDGVMIPVGSRLNAASIIEDTVERPMRRNLSLAENFKRNSRNEIIGRGYLPAAEYMRATVLDLVNKQLKTMEPGDPLYDDFLVLKSIFAPHDGKAGNIEMFSKFESAVVYRVDAPHNIGHAALSKIADDIRSNMGVYAPFLALLNAMRGGVRAKAAANGAVPLSGLERTVDAWAPDSHVAEDIHAELNAAASYLVGLVSKFNGREQSPATTFRHDWDRAAEEARSEAVAEHQGDPGGELPKDKGGRPPDTATKSEVPKVPVQDTNDTAVESVAVTPGSPSSPGEGTDLGGYNNSVLAAIANDKPVAQYMVQIAMRMQEAGMLPRSIPPDPDLNIPVDDTDNKDLRGRLSEMDRGKLTRVANAAVRVLSHYGDPSGLSASTRGGKTVAERLVDAVVGTDAPVEDEDRPMADLKLGSTSKQMALQTSDSYRLFKAVTRLLTRKTGEATLDPVLSMRTSVIENPGGGTRLAARALNPAYRYASVDASPFHDPVAFRQLVEELIHGGRDVSDDDEAALKALGVTLQALGYLQGRQLLTYVSNMAGAGLYSFHVQRHVEISDTGVGRGRIVDSKTDERLADNPGISSETRKIKPRSTATDADTGHAPGLAILGALKNNRAGAADYLERLDAATVALWTKLKPKSAALLEAVAVGNTRLTASEITSAVTNLLKNTSIADREVRELLAEVFNALSAGASPVAAALRNDAVWRGLRNGWDPMNPRTATEQAGAAEATMLRGLIAAAFAGARSARRMLKEDSGLQVTDDDAATAKLFREELVPQMQTAMDRANSTEVDDRHPLNIENRGNVSRFMYEARRNEILTSGSDYFGGKRTSGQLASPPNMIAELASTEGISDDLLKTLGVPGDETSLEWARARMARDAVWPDGSPILIAVTGVHTYKTPRDISSDSVPAQHPAETLRRMFDSRIRAVSGVAANKRAIGVPLYAGDHGQYVFMLPAELVNAMPINSTLNDAYLNLLEWMPSLLTPVQRHALVNSKLMAARDVKDPVFTTVAVGRLDVKTGAVATVEGMQGLGVTAGYAMPGEGKPEKYHATGKGVALKTAITGVNRIEHMPEDWKPGNDKEYIDKAVFGFSKKGKGDHNRVFFTDTNGAKISKVHGSSAILNDRNDTPGTLIGRALAAEKLPPAAPGTTVSYTGEKAASLLSEYAAVTGQPPEKAVDDFPGLEVHVVYPRVGSRTGKPLLVVGYDIDLRVQLAANIAHPPDAVWISKPINVLHGARAHESGRTREASNRAATTIVDVMDALDITPEELKADPKLLEDIASRDRDRVIEVLAKFHPFLNDRIATLGAWPGDREIRGLTAQVLGKRLAAMLAPRSYGVWLVNQANGEDVVWDTEAQDMTRPKFYDDTLAYPVISTLFSDRPEPGDRDEFVEQSEVFTKAESISEFGGLTSRPTLIRANIRTPWTREALFFNEERPEFQKKLPDGSTVQMNDREMVDEVSRRLYALETLRAMRPPARVYLSFIRHELAPLFLHHDGSSLFTDRDGYPLQTPADRAGRERAEMEPVSFDDLIIPNPGKGATGTMVDRAAFYYNIPGSDEEPGHNDRKGGRIMLAGTVFTGERVPSAHPASSDLLRLSLPVASRRPDADNGDTRETIGADGRRHTVPDRRRLRPVDENLVVLSGERVLKGGGDSDGDERIGEVFYLDSDSGMLLSGSNMSSGEIAAEAKRLIDSGMDEQKAVDLAMAGINNDVTVAQMTDKRAMDVRRAPGYDSKAIRSGKIRYSNLFTMETMPVTPEVFSRKFNSAVFEGDRELSLPKFSDVVDPNDTHGAVRHLFPAGVVMPSGGFGFQEYRDKIDAAIGNGDFSHKALVRKPEPVDIRNLESVTKRSDSVKTVAEHSRGITVAFLNRLNNLRTLNAWDLVRHTTTDKGNVVVKGIKAPTSEEFNRLRNWIMRISNLAFDEEKQARFTRTGFSAPNNVPLYLAGLLGRNWQSDAELEAYHAMWMLWENTTEGLMSGGDRFYEPPGEAWDRVRAMDRESKALSAIAEPTNRIPANGFAALAVQNILTEKLAYLVGLLEKNVQLTDVDRRMLPMVRVRESMIERLLRYYFGTVVTAADMNRYIEARAEQVAIKNSNSKDSKEASKRLQAMLPIEKAAEALEHAWDIIAARNLVAEKAPTLYDFMSERNISDAEFFFIVNQGWASLKAGTFPKLANNRIVRTMGRYSRNEGAGSTRKSVFTSAIRMPGADTSIDMDQAALDFADMYNNLQEIPITIDRADSQIKFNLKVRDLVILTPWYNALTASKVTVRPSAYGGFAYMFHEAVLDEFLKRRTVAAAVQLPNEVFETVIYGGQRGPLRNADRGSRTEAPPALRLNGYHLGVNSPAHALGTRGVSASAVEHFPNGSTRDYEITDVTLEPDGSTGEARLNSSMPTAASYSFIDPWASLTQGFAFPATGSDVYNKLRDSSPKPAASRWNGYPVGIMENMQRSRQVNSAVGHVLSKVLKDAKNPDALPNEAAEVTSALENAVNREAVVPDLEESLRLGWDNASEEERIAALSEVQNAVVDAGINDVTLTKTFDALKTPGFGSVFNIPGRELYTKYAKELRTYPLRASEEVTKAAIKEREESKGASPEHYSVLSAKKIRGITMGVTGVTTKYTGGKAVIAAYEKPEVRHQSSRDDDRYSTTVTTAIKEIVPFTGPPGSPAAAEGTWAHNHLGIIMEHPELEAVGEPADVAWLNSAREALLNAETRYTPDDYYFMVETVDKQGEKHVAHTRGKTSMQVGELFGVPDLVLINKKTGAFVVVDYKVRDKSQWYDYTDPGQQRFVSERQKRHAQVMVLENMLRSLGFTRESPGYILNYDVSDTDHAFLEQIVEDGDIGRPAVALAMLVSSRMDPARANVEHGEAMDRLRGEIFGFKDDIRLPEGNENLLAKIEDDARAGYNMFRDGPGTEIVPGYLGVQNSIVNLGASTVAKANDIAYRDQLPVIAKDIESALTAAKQDSSTPQAASAAESLLTSPFMTEFINPPHAGDKGLSAGLQVLGIQKAAATRIIGTRRAGIPQSGRGLSRDWQALDQLDRLVSAMARLQRNMVYIYTILPQGAKEFDRLNGTRNDIDIHAPKEEHPLARIVMSPESASPYTGIPDMPSEFITRRVLSGPQYFKEFILPRFRDISMREVVGNRDLEAIPTEALNFAAMFQGTYASLDGEHLTKVTALDVDQFRVDPATGERVVIKPGDPDYVPALRYSRLNMKNRLTPRLRPPQEHIEALNWHVGQALAAEIRGDDSVHMDIRLSSENFKVYNAKGKLVLKLLTSVDVEGIKPGDSSRMRVNVMDGKSTAIHVAITRAHAAMPAFAFNEFMKVLAASATEATGRVVAENGATAENNPTGLDAALHNNYLAGILEEKGWVTARRSGNSVISMTITVPTKLSEQVILSNELKTKKGIGIRDSLEASGRDKIETMYNLKSLAREFKMQFLKLQDRALRSVPDSISNIDFQRAFVLRGPIPFMSGGGAYRQFNRATGEQSMLSTQELVEEISEAFKDVSRNASQGVLLRRWKNIPTSQLLLFKDLAGLPDDAGSLSKIWSDMKRGAYASDYGIPRDAIMADFTRAIYKLALKRVAENALTEGDPEVLPQKQKRAGAVVEAMRRMAVSNGWDLDLAGMTTADIYRKTGLLPANMGAAELLTAWAHNLTARVKQVSMFNASLMQTDAQGRPVNFADPADIDNGVIVSEPMWEMLARWWSETEGAGNEKAKYDPSQSGVDNAHRIFEELSKLSTTKEKAGPAVYDKKTGTPITKYRLFSKTGMHSVQRVMSKLADPDDDMQSWLALRRGGENAAWMEHLLGTAALDDPGWALDKLNKISVRYKALAMTLSAFHLVAEGESYFASEGLTKGALGIVSPRGARALGSTKLGKSLNMSPTTVGQLDILRMLQSNDPWLLELKELCAVLGIPLSDATHNPWDMDRHVFRKDMRRLTELAEAHDIPMPDAAKRLISDGLYMLQEGNMEYTFGHIANAVKMAVTANLVTKLREEASRRGKNWDPIRDLRRHAPKVNAEIGLLDPAMYPWLTPKAARLQKLLWLSYQWTFGAWEAGGGGVLSYKATGFRFHPDVQSGVPLRWARMAGGVMFGIPMMLQLALRMGFAKFADDDDKWWIWQNEPGRRFSFNLNPALRAMAAAPGVEWARHNVPVLGRLLPAALGDDPTFGNRKTYMHFGKQGWEILRYFTDGFDALYSKLNLPLQRMWVALAGGAPNSKFDMPFKGRSIMESWTDRAGYILAGLKPLSYSTMERNKDAGFLTMIGPVSKGVSASGAVDALGDVFRAYSKPSYYDKLRESAHYWNDVPALAVDNLRAAEANGHDPDAIMRDAMRPILRDLYREVYQALPNRPGGRVDTRRLGKALAALHRVDFVYSNLLLSIKARDKRNKGKINLTKEVLQQRDQALREAFWYPNGRFKVKKTLPGEDKITPTKADVLGSGTTSAAGDMVRRLLED